LALGLALVEKARARSLALTIDIVRGGQQLFHYACPGTCPDNDQWVLRKSRVVLRLGKSSLHVGARLRRDGLTIEQKYFMSPLEYSAHGGSFPIHIQGSGVVGAISVSGLPQEEDHAFVVEVIGEFIRGRTTT
jgi:uncharacterized protein (UPF0303 family)